MRRTPTRRRGNAAEFRSLYANELPRVDELLREATRYGGRHVPSILTMLRFILRREVGRVGEVLPGTTDRPTPEYRFQCAMKCNLPDVRAYVKEFITQEGGGQSR